MNSGNDFTKHIHVKNIIRLLSILLMVFFFVPSFMVYPVLDMEILKLVLLKL